LYWLLGIGEAKYSEDFRVLKKLSIAVLTKFGFGERAMMERQIHDEAGELIKYIECKEGKAFDVKYVMHRTTMNVMYNIMFGQRFEAGDPICDYIMNSAETLNKTIHPVFDLFPLARFVPPFKGLLKDVATHSRKLNAFYAERVKECLANSSEENNFVKEFMKEAGTRFDETDAAFVVRDFVIGGTETSATQILWAIVLIGNHPIVQECLRKEIDSVVLRSRLPSINDKASLPYFEATMLEIMRIRNLGPLAVPRTTLCDTEAGGFFIPVNTQVA